MTYAPQDLQDTRAYVMSKTGLTAVECGIVGDPAHAATGGYHEGNDDLMAAGVLYTDYSKADSPRDRPGSNAASALDVGLFWDQGSQAAINFSLWVRDKLLANDPRCADMRGMNYTPDGSTKRRVDRLYNNFQVTSSTDSVDIHTHFEFFRDSEGRRSRNDNFLGLVKEYFGDLQPVPPPAPVLPLEERMPDTQIPHGFDQNDTVILSFPTTEAHGVTIAIDTGKQPNADPSLPDVDVTDAWFRVVAHGATDANGTWGAIQTIKCNSAKRRVDYSWAASASIDHVSIRRIPAFDGDLGRLPASVMKF